MLPAVRALGRKLEVTCRQEPYRGAAPLRGIRRALTQRMAAVHAAVVPATVMEEADIASNG